MFNTNPHEINRGFQSISMSDWTGLKNDTVPASKKRVKEDEPGQATFDIINHVEQRKSGTQGDNGDKHTTSPHPYQSQTKEEGGEIKAESRRLLTLSIMSGRLVAASTVTSRSCSMPSISVRSWARTRSPTPPEPEELDERMGTQDRWVDVIKRGG